MERYSEAVATFVRGLRLDEIPLEVSEKAKLIFLDTLGIALASSTMDFGRMVLEVAHGLGGPSESRLISRPQRVAAPNAVLANGTLAHGLDYDDTLEEAIVHTGCCGATTALAVGEELESTGKSVLEAVVVGIEVMCKVGLVAPGKFHARGFHPTGLCSTFGAAAAAGRLYGLKESQMVDAFGICGSQSSGIIEYLADGSWTKRLHPGWSAHGGIIAARLGQKSFKGPVSVFDGRHSFYHAFVGDDPVRLEKLKELGKIWEIPKIVFKSYPCGSISHPYMDCALRLREDHAIRAEDVEEVICRTAEGPVHRLWEPLKEKQRPSSSYGAKFSLPYSIATMLIRGKAGLEEFSEKAIHDSEVLSLAGKVRYELDPEIDYPRHFSGHVKIRLKNGATLEENQPYPRGGLESPFTLAEIEGKFCANAGLALPRERVEKIVGTVSGLEKLPSIGALADLLSPD